jgi:GNAT superfamily N-acetyltransferase
MQRLDPLHYDSLRAKIAAAKMNTLVAQQVLLGNVTGDVYADLSGAHAGASASTSAGAPAAALIRHPYGMALLFGAMEHGDFAREVRDFALNRDGRRSAPEWLQIAPPEACEKFDALVADHLAVAAADEAADEAPAGGPEADTAVRKYQRVNFAFDRERYEARPRPTLPPGHEVVQTTPEIFNTFTGHVVPSKFWDSAEDFERMGLGFSVRSAEGETRSTAFASFVVGDTLELGVETKADHHGKGLAGAACAALIDYCLARGYEPVWSCHGGNVGSRRLAGGLGFREALRVPYYRLPAAPIPEGS